MDDWRLKYVIRVRDLRAKLALGESLKRRQAQARLLSRITAAPQPEPASDGESSAAPEPSAQGNGETPAPPVKGLGIAKGARPPGKR